MIRRPIDLHRLAMPALLAIGVSTTLPAEEPAAGHEAPAAEVMQSVFGNRVRDGGYWRQDNEAFAEDAEAPKYWMQVWRNGPAGEVVIVDAYEVQADDTCSALIHIVYTYDGESGRIQSDAYGANGMSGHGVMEFEGTVTTTEATIHLPGGRQVRMRDREDQGAAEVVDVKAETWDGETWVPGKPATWRRSAAGLPCDAAGPARLDP